MTSADSLQACARPAADGAHDGAAVRVAEGVPFVHRAVRDGDSIADVVVKVVDNAVGALLNYRNAAASHAIERAVCGRYSPMVSRLLHLLIIDILSTGVALRLGSGKQRPLP